MLSLYVVPVDQRNMLPSFSGSDVGSRFLRNVSNHWCDSVVLQHSGSQSKPSAL